MGKKILQKALLFILNKFCYNNVDGGNDIYYDDDDDDGRS